MAGPDSVGWGSKLMRLAEDLGVANRIHWPGMLKGDQKWGAFRAAEAFVLPSHQRDRSTRKIFRYDGQGNARVSKRPALTPSAPPAYRLLASSGEGGTAERARKLFDDEMRRGPGGNQKRGHRQHVDGEGSAQEATRSPPVCAVSPKLPKLASTEPSSTLMTFLLATVARLRPRQLPGQLPCQRRALETGRPSVLPPACIDIG
jgi:hypothetical protein